MTIAPGTLCLLVAPHCRAGTCCTVIGRLSGPLHIWDGPLRRESVSADEYYNIESPSFPPISGDSHGWAARRRELVPLAPPGNPEEYREPKATWDDERERAR